MQARIEVKDRNERDAIQLALEDPETRAYVVVCGILRQLPDDPARLRVLQCAEILLSSAPGRRAAPRNGDDGERLRLLDGSGPSGSGE